MSFEPSESPVRNQTENEPMQVLERFVLHNTDLTRIEEIANPFNIFEALGIVRQETRHSNFLAWLLDPTQSHQLADSFLKRFLMQSSSRARESGIETISPIDVDVWDLAETEVRREWRNVDVMLINDARNFVCVIENKIHASEHGDQLRRYRQLTNEAYPGWSHHFVFLTATGEEPSDNAHYVTVTYDDVCETIEYVQKTKGSAISDELEIALSHYVAMVRRHIMPNLELEELCRRIYSKHRQALDLIFEHRPDLQSDLQREILEMLKGEPDFIQDHSSKQYIRFLPKAWDTDKMRRGEGWTQSHRMLLLQFANRPDSLTLTLHTGPGDQEVREELFNLVLEVGVPFRPNQKTLPPKWLQIYDKRILKPKDYEEPDIEQMMIRVRKAWSDFKTVDLSKIHEALEPVLT